MVASLLGVLGIRVRHPQFLLLCVPYARAACAFLLLEQHGFSNLGELAAVLALRVHAGCCGCSAAGAMWRAAGMLLPLLAAVDMAVAQELDAEAAAARLRKGYGRMYKRFRLTRFASSLLRLVPQHSLRVGGDSGCCKVDWRLLISDALVAGTSPPAMSRLRTGWTTRPRANRCVSIQLMGWPCHDH